MNCVDLAGKQASEPAQWGWWLRFSSSDKELALWHLHPSAELERKMIRIALQPADQRLYTKVWNHCWFIAHCWSIAACFKQDGAASIKENNSGLFFFCRNNQANNNNKKNPTNNNAKGSFSSAKMHPFTSSKYWADWLGASLFLESAELEKYLWEAVVVWKQLHVKSFYKAVINGGDTILGCASSQLLNFCRNTVLQLQMLLKGILPENSPWLCGLTFKRNAKGYKNSKTKEACLGLRVCRNVYLRKNCNIQKTAFFLLICVRWGRT